MSSRSSYIPSTSEEWLQKVHHAQTQHMTPERRDRVRQGVENSRRAEISRRKVHAVKSHAVRTSALVNEGLRQMCAVSEPSEYIAVQGRYQSAQIASEQRQDLQLSAVARMEESESANDASVWHDAEEEELGMREAAALVGAADAGALSHQASAEPQHVDADFSNLLRQLVREPSNEEELVAKFGLYETYSEQVTKMRASLFSVYEENQSSVPPKVAQDMSQQLKRMDNTHAMGVEDHTREWFVYHMMKKAGKNNQTMGKILDGFGRKLDFLAKTEQEECPICLEKFSDESPSETLGCCHQVCRTCWDHWTAVMHGHPFCPLCKNEDFIQHVVSLAST